MFNLSQYLIIYLALALLVYALIPTALARLCSLGVISRLPAGKRVCLTFDDGPDPRYTPQLLEILGKAGVKACFFLMGEKVGKYPELVKRIIAEGHEIGSHGFSHRNHWLLGPLGTIREIKKSFRAIEEIAGFTPDAFRPPWGLFTLSHLAARLVLGYRIVLWSFMSWDWTRGSTPEKIAEKVRKKLADGSILLFHDSDTGPGASAGSPKNMLKALPEILDDIKKRDYRIVPLKDFINARKVFLNQLLLVPWRLLDYMFRLFLHIKDVAGEDGKPTIFSISTRRYAGPRVDMPHEKVLMPGEIICELHLNNNHIKKLLLGESRPEILGVKVARELRRSLPALAGKVYSDPKFEGIEFLAGITMLHRGSSMAGFISAEIPSPVIRRIIAAYQGILLRLYHPSGKERLNGTGNMDPRIVVISKYTLFSRHLKNRPDN